MVYTYNTTIKVLISPLDPVIDISASERHEAYCRLMHVLIVTL